MQTVIEFNPHQSDDVHKHRKESTFRRQLTLVDLDKGADLATVRFYGFGSRNYCCAWLHGDAAKYARGSAWAGGYGYHKDSDAMQTALRVAGVKFSENFGGVGEHGEREALEALAAFFGAKRVLIIAAHG